MNSSIRKINKVAGLSLVELMVAVALGSFLSIGIVQLYASHRLTANNTEGVSQIQDNSRYALSLISSHARMAGYTGCISKDRGLADDDTSDDIPITNLLNDSDSVTYNFGEAITGYDDVGEALNADLAAALTGDPAPEAGTDVLVLRGASDDSVAITRNNNSAQFFAEVNSTEPGACENGKDRLSGLCIDDIVLASDCEKSVVFQITNLQQVGGNVDMNVVHSASGTPGNSRSSWGGNSSNDMIGADGEIIKMQTNLYYVGDNNGRPALYRKINGSSAAVVADNVVDFQVTYGEDTDTEQDYEVNTYNDASGVSDWSRVLSVRMNLLVASDNNNIVGPYGSDDRMTVPFNGQTYTAPDRRLYRTVVSTVVLRNRAQ